MAEPRDRNGDEVEDVDLEDDDPDRPAAIRPFWSGTITFGLVSVPVNLYAAQRSRRVSLRMLSPEGRPLRRRYVCPEHDREVPREEIVRGYEVDGGEYVLVRDEELASLEPEKSRDIDLRRFVPRDQVDPLMFVRAYFLAPAGETTKAYRLLAEVMERSAMAGIATFVMRGREYLIAILAENGILRAETLRFSDEVRTPEYVGLPDRAEVEDEAVEAVASELAGVIRTRAEESFAPEEVRDRWAERLLGLVERKLDEGEGVVETAAAPEPERRTDVIDLMEALKRRISGAGAGHGDGREPEEALDERTKGELYERARALDIPGRSRMSKEELIRAIRETS